MSNHDSEIIDTIEFKKAIFEFRKDDIVILTVKGNENMEMADAIEQNEMFAKTKQHIIPVRILIKGGLGSSTSKEVRDYANSEEQRALVRAQAFVVKSLAQKIVANFILKFYKSPVNLKIFSEEVEAINWLKKQ